MQRHSEGKNYQQTRDLPHTEVAKLIRQDVKKAIKAGKLPKDIKVSVRARWATHTPAIDVEITALPSTKLWEKVELPTGARPSHIGVHEHASEEGKYWRRTGAEEKYLRVLTEIHDSYNMDRSDSMTDYFHVRYYGRAEVGHEMIARRLNELKAKEDGDSKAMLTLVMEQAGVDAWIWAHNMDEASVEHALLWFDAAHSGASLPSPSPFAVRATGTRGPKVRPLTRIWKTKKARAKALKFGIDVK